MFSRRLFQSMVSINIIREGEALKRLEYVIEPITGKPISSLVGMLKGLSVNDGDIKIELDRIVPGYSYHKEVNCHIIEI